MQRDAAEMPSVVLADRRAQMNPGAIIAVPSAAEVTKGTYTDPRGAQEGFEEVSAMLPMGGFTKVITESHA
jgi:hypothetical protein